MPWIQVSITTTSDSYQHAEDTLLALGAQSVTFKDAADRPILEPVPGETPLWHDVIVTGLFDDSYTPDLLRRQIGQHLDSKGMKIDFDILQDQDWTRAWMKNYAPMQFGQRLWVCPRHLEPPDQQATNLRLDPGLAFGTGTHPTTALCLRWLDAHVFPHSGHRQLLDYGCGSGILAIAAILLGAGHADCVDIDEQALQATTENAQTNHVAGHIATCTPGSLGTHRRYQLVLANILSGPLTELAPRLAQYCQTGGDIVLSGILQEQADEVRKAYSESFAMDEPSAEQGWVLLHGTRLE